MKFWSHQLRFDTKMSPRFKFLLLISFLVSLCRVFGRNQNSKYVHILSSADNKH